MKTIDFIEHSTPENPPFGYGDNVAVFDGGEQLFIGACSVQPNAYALADKKPWPDVFAKVAPGALQGVTVEDDKFGMCIAINNRNFVPTVNPNYNHAGAYMANGVLIHKGHSVTCRGSKACLTIHPDRWVEFIALFETGEKVKINIRGRDVA